MTDPPTREEPTESTVDDDLPTYTYPHRRTSQMAAPRQPPKRRLWFLGAGCTALIVLSTVAIVSRNRSSQNASQRPLTTSTPRLRNPICTSSTATGRCPEAAWDAALRLNDDCRKLIVTAAAALGQTVAEFAHEFNLETDRARKPRMPRSLTPSSRPKRISSVLPISSPTLQSGCIRSMPPSSLLGPARVGPRRRPPPTCRLAPSPRRFAHSGRSRVAM